MDLILHSIRMRLPGGWLCPSVALLWVVLLVPSPARAADQGWIQFELKGGHVTVPSRVGDQSGYAVIDTGASAVAVNENLAAKLNLKVSRRKIAQIAGVTGTAVRPIYRRVSVNLFGADFEFKDITDMSAGDDALQLLVGGPILRRFIFQFDYPNSRLRALPRKALKLNKISNIESKRDSRGGKLPVVRVTLNDQAELWLAMDTGNSGGLLISRQVAERHGWLAEFDVQDGFIGGVNGIAATQSFVLPVLGFGPVTLEDVTVIVPADGVDLPAVGDGRAWQRAYWAMTFCSTLS
ncbi:MAG: aspartyl protease family protein [Pseudomonadota bacterium]